MKKIAGAWGGGELSANNVFLARENVDKHYLWMKQS